MRQGERERARWMVTQVEGQNIGESLAVSLCHNLMKMQT